MSTTSTNTASLPAHLQILANDERGLTLGSSSSSTHNMNTAQAGVYTSLVQLAAQLSTANVTTHATQGSSSTTEKAAPPLITLETAEYAILVKDYAGWAVAVQAPKKKATLPPPESSTTTEYNENG